MSLSESVSHEEKESSSVEEAARDGKLAELSILKESLEASQEQSKDYYEQLLRLAAEFENYRKRTEQQSEEQYRSGRQKVLIELISVLDILEKALSSADSASDPKSIAQGINLLSMEFLKFLKSEGVIAMGEVGEEFDPLKHEAVEKTVSDLPEGKVVIVLQKGYCLDGKLIRPAQVKVSGG